ncbi:hypothetical protein A2810_02750 [candidate division Kazan bacterium RIFCSPHIGHO2_01_FULL_49_10]|nr:MAG: hypothetical protein A2810_02750 [candidate division Kazan bacterium RIFCSPHIGHO2_01_FULL_49_10]
MTYADVGVRYDDMDPFKVAAQKEAARTAANAERLGWAHVPWSGGESTCLFAPNGGRAPGYLMIAHTEEGLGTKNLVADAMYALTNELYYHFIAQDAVAMIVNDVITLGALPLSIAMHLATGSSDWFKDEARCLNLIRGWADACMLARCVWSGGETPTLKDVVMPKAFVLSGSVIGIVPNRSQHAMRPDEIQNGDAIIVIESSGVHANGLTLARAIADKLPDGYLTKLPDGRTYGETLLDPTLIYVRAIEACFGAGVRLHYGVNVTGHGWRKFMRAPQPHAYVIERLPTQLPIFDFLQEHSGIDDEQAYDTFNMGAGFALYLPREDAEDAISVIKNLGFRAFNAGHVEAAQQKSVAILPKNIEYGEETLAIRQ